MGSVAWRRGSTYCCEEEFRQEDRCEKEPDWYLVPRGLYLDLGARMQHRFCTLALLTVALVAPLQAKQDASETSAALQIRVLDGRNGTPIKDEAINLWFDEQDGSPVPLQTNEAGVALVPA